MDRARTRSARFALARNRALFRALNENLRTLNEAFASMTGTFTIACECADANCVEMVEIDPSEYLAVRKEPRHFAVLSRHVYPEVEVAVRESERYVVVEKTALGRRHRRDPCQGDGRATPLMSTGAVREELPH